jgi:hypothetical protein
MAKVKLDFKRLPIAEKIVRAQQIVKNLTDNPDFPNPDPPLAEVTAAINLLETKVVAAQAARQAARASTAEQNDAEDALDQIIDRVGGHIESASGGDEAKIIAAGVSVRASTAATRDLSVPAALSATEGDHDGEIQLHWDRVGAARSYVIERSADPPTDTSWVHEKVVTTSSTMISGLTRGAKYWFRVAAIGAAGQSGWSDPATKIAP